MSRKVSLHDTRNIGIMAHIDAGPTRRDLVSREGMIFSKAALNTSRGSLPVFSFA